MRLDAAALVVSRHHGKDLVAEQHRPGRAMARPGTTMFFG